MSGWSRHFPNSLPLVLVCLLCLGMLVACGRTRPPQSPSDVGSLPPAIEHEPEQAERIPPEKQATSIRQIHERIFQEAQDFFEAEEFQKAIREFARLLALNPQVDLEKEGHWGMGQSYDQMGNLEAAQEEYRHLASAPIGERYQSHSSQRLKEIQSLLEKRELPPKNTQAIRFAFNQLPGAEGFEQGIHKMKQDGVTTLLIDLGCERMALSTAA
ncbi:MAG: tetratricopeptide repeat protein, partial [Nitrospirota bacterium]|nr:tetratricopeptide repeat protein [Nitrospirota bacterium]